MSSDAPTPTAHERQAELADGSYPRPQLVRARWSELDGPWRFSFDDTDSGLDAGWQNSAEFDLTITVPYPFESALSGIGDTGFHRVVWYARSVSADQLREAGFGGIDSGGDDARRLMLHFGAVDYRAMVWLNGVFLGSHEGGQTPFSFDITSALDDERAEQLLVVRAEDDPADVAQPRANRTGGSNPTRSGTTARPASGSPSGSRRPRPWRFACCTGFRMCRAALSRCASISPRSEPGTVIDVALSYEGRIVGELTA